MPVAIDAGELVDIDAELGVLVPTGIVVVGGGHCRRLVAAVGVVGWLRACAAMWWSARGGGGDRCRHRWVDRAWACSWMLHSDGHHRLLLSQYWSVKKKKLTCWEHIGVNTWVWPVWAWSWMLVVVIAATAAIVVVTALEGLECKEKILK